MFRKCAASHYMGKLLFSRPWLFLKLFMYLTLHQSHLMSFILCARFKKVSSGMASGHKSNTVLLLIIMKKEVSRILILGQNLKRFIYLGQPVITVTISTHGCRCLTIFLLTHFYQTLYFSQIYRWTRLLFLSFLFPRKLSLIGSIFLNTIQILHL